MNPPIPFTSVVLDRVRRIRYSNRAIQRVGQLPNALTLADLSEPSHQQAALVQWLWGCLIEDDAKAFDAPEDLADALPCPLTPENVGAMTAALVQAFNLVHPSTEKNADSSTPSPAPASS